MIGGVFDPVHIGHISIARACIQALDLENVSFIPANIPPHKTGAVAAPQHRQAMLARALEPFPQLSVCDIELNRGGISYTVDTLAQLRAGEPERSFCFIMGADAFTNLPAWRRWQELTDYAHLVIIDRKQPPESRWPPHLQNHYDAHACVSARALHTRPGGFIHKAAVSVPEVSSSRARMLLQQKRNTEHILPAGIQDYITENDLYL